MNKCCICGQEIGAERVEVLRNIFKYEPHQFICLKCASMHVKPVSGYYEGFSGHDLKVCQNVGKETGIIKEDEEDFVEFKKELEENENIS